jgi:ABC-type multidrug transport system fused ATPase/permease subunit
MPATRPVSSGLETGSAMIFRSSYFTRLSKMLWEERSAFIPAVVCMGVTAGLLMAAPYWVRNLVDNILPARSFSLLTRHMLLGFLLLGCIQGFSYIRDYLRLRLTQSICARTRRKLFEKIVQIPVRYIPEQRIGDILSRVSNDVKVLQEGLLWGVFVFLPSSVILIGLTGMMFHYSLVLGVVTFFLFFPLIWIFHYFVIRIRRRSRAAQEQMAYLNNMVEESLTGLKEIKIFRQEERVKRRFEELNQRSLAAHISQEKMRVLLVAVVPTLAFIGVGFLVIFCAWMISRGMLELSSLVAFLTCIGLAFSPVQRLTRSIGFISRIYAVMDRFDEIFQSPSEQISSSHQPDLPIVQGQIRFEKVGFHYDNGFSMQELNLEAIPGEIVAIVGPSGSGKTTLLNLLQRFLEPDSGVISIDGWNIERYNLDSLRRQIGFVPQEPVLFDGTLMENLTFARPDSDMERVLEAARSAHVHEFASKLPLEYNTPIGQHGCRLSTGQRQRVAIARMFLTDPRILIMDEPTSALDSESEFLIQDSLKCLFSGRTTFIVAHRMNTLRDADRILVLNNGRIVENGTPDTLLKKQGLYHKLYTFQQMT